MAATITRGKTFGATEQVTNTKLHQLVDSATIAGIDASNMASGQGTITRSTSAPSVTDGIWVDTNCSPPVVRIYDGTEWVATGAFAVLTNKSGGTRSAGDVVVVDTTTNGSFTTTTTSGNPLCPMIVMESIANNADGIVALAGARVTNVAVDGTTTRGQYLKTSSSAGLATPVSTPVQGVFAIALSARTGAGAITEALLIGVSTPAVSTLPKGYLNGILLSNNGSDATNDLDISAGVARDDTNAYDLTLASAITKRGDASFTAGTGNGGGNITGAAKRVYIFLIGKSTDSSAIDVIFDTSRTSPTMPSTWDIKRLIGHRYWDGSKWALFTTRGNGVRKDVWLYQPIEFLTSQTTGTFADVDLSAYLDGNIAQTIEFTIGNGIGTAYVRIKGSTAAADSKTTYCYGNIQIAGGKVPLSTAGIMQSQDNGSGAGNNHSFTLLAWYEDL